MELYSSLPELIETYLSFCTSRKNLDLKTIKSYSIDLKQFTDFIFSKSLEWNTKKSLEQYIDILHNKCKPKSVKRKIASLKAFFHYLELEEIIEINPFHKIQVKYKEPFILPKTIPLSLIEQIIKFAYAEYNNSTTFYSKKTALRNILILEVLFATGMRISELCSLTLDCLDLSTYIIKIYGKGSKERLIQICNKNIQNLIDQYCKEFQFELSYKKFLFINRLGNRLSEQSVRNMITNYAERANISYILLRICFDILLQLSCLKRMLIYDIFSKCSVTVLLLQRRFTHIPALTNRRIFYLPSTQETSLKSGYNKSLASF